jgi:hypothetical protein
MREKLIELLESTVSKEEVAAYGEVYVSTSRVADHLIANGVTIQKWIPVSERLPEIRERVLVYHDDGMIRFGINYGGFADVVSSIYLNHNHHTCFSKVTHWMPLPEPPKEDE